MAGYCCELVSGCERLAPKPHVVRLLPLGGECVQKRPFRLAMRATVIILRGWAGAHSPGDPGLGCCAFARLDESKSGGAFGARSRSWPGAIGQLCNTVYKTTAIIHCRRCEELSGRWWRWNRLQESRSMMEKFPSFTWSLGRYAPCATHRLHLCHTSPRHARCARKTRYSRED